MGTKISIIIFTFILFLILFVGKAYYDDIGLKIADGEKNNEGGNGYEYDDNNRDKYFTDKDIDCQETIAGYEECVTVGQDLVTVSQHPVNAGKACTEKLCKGVHIYNCDTHGKERLVYIQRKTDNKYLNIELKPCADWEKLKDRNIDSGKKEDMKCKDSDIGRITNTDSDVSWDVILKWEHYHEVGWVSPWALKIKPIDDSGRDSFDIYTRIRDKKYGIDKTIYLVPTEWTRQLNYRQIKLSYDESAFHEHSPWSDGVNLICEADNTQMVRYEPTFIGCPTNRYENKTIVGFTSKSKIKRKSDGKYLVISGPKLLEYYADRAQAEDYEFQKVYDVGTATNMSMIGGGEDTGPVVTDIDNRTSKHQLCFGGDSDHVSYTENVDEATIFSIKEDDNNLTIKVEFEVTNFNITEGTTQIGSYQSPHTVTKYIELLGNGDLSLCNKINHSLYTSQKGYSDARGMDWHTSDTWYGDWTRFHTTTQYASGKITALNKSNGYCCQCSLYSPNNEWCFYGPSDSITNSYSSFNQRYEFDHIEKEDITREMEIDHSPNCVNKTADEMACQMDYKKCTSYEEFYPHHGTMLNYSFGKCVPKTSFLNKLATEEGPEPGVLKWYSGFTDIVTKRCDQSIDCKSGLKSSYLFHEESDRIAHNEYTSEFIKDCLSSITNLPASEEYETKADVCCTKFGAESGCWTENTSSKVWEIEEDEMDSSSLGYGITYKDACTNKTD